jgi:hypothetical protein
MSKIVFGVALLALIDGAYSTLSEWQQATGQDGGSVWRKPDGSYPLPAKAEVVGEDIPVHRQ